VKPVLDASALLAYLHQEPGSAEVKAVIGDAVIGTVNWCEVAQKVEQRGLDTAQVTRLLEEMGLEIVPFSSAQANLAAQLWEQTRRHGLSLADRACLALAIEHNAAVLTADRAWAELALDIEIQLIR